MRKLHLVAMSYDKDAILNSLQRSGAVEVTFHAFSKDTFVKKLNTEELETRLAVAQTALSALSREIENYERDYGKKSDLLKDGFEVDYKEFISCKEKSSLLESTIEKINALTDEKNGLKAELSKITREKEAEKIYARMKKPFSYYADTPKTRVRLGLIALNVLENAMKTLQENPLCVAKVLFKDEENALCLVIAHKSAEAETDGVLSAFGFIECPYKGEQTGAELFAETVKREIETVQAIEQNRATTYALSGEIRQLKIYCDYLTFELEKAKTNEKLLETERTFSLQAYVPKDAEERVKEELSGVTQTTWLEFTQPTKDDTPPTLLKNNAIVANFEGITNTYSAPHYREFDPNAVMAFFYSLFMGFIIGDAGYGLLMFFGGGYLWWKGLKRPTGMSRLAGAFAVGGIFAILWGLLFNSLFGFVILPKTVMPNPQTDMWSLAGISVPSVLLISMEIGIFQLFVGYLCRAVQEWRRGKVVDGVCDGLLWAIFSVGVALAIVGFIDEANLPILATVGGITAGVTLLLAILTAGRKEKFLGKFTKGFGAAYGVINYASDILSYARLYGLMLSGAVIAQIIATYSGQFILSGNVGLIALGVVLLVVGNAFNLVMNLLGAYIHDARLQYVEFYGRFYEG
ncbi:MAG: V-type ATP synthase subunit I, partial [Clostridiales bacterium]|nr:V-type ATP synthase subunit I [Clostridiales bacterium]